MIALHHAAIVNTSTIPHLQLKLLKSRPLTERRPTPKGLVAMLDIFSLLSPPAPQIVRWTFIKLLITL